ncbi:MAG: class I SAM-dependent methyltransferase [Chloroflexota bacterium]
MKVPKWFFDAVTNYRANRIAGYLSEQMMPGETVLDCGCGSMFIADLLQQRHGLIAFGADVIQLNQRNHQFCMCSAEKLAFRDESFDNACLIFALHHMSDPLAAIQECLRVTKKRLIVLEDVYENIFELQMLKFFDHHGNRIISEDMHLPFNFKTETEWKTTFENLAVKVMAVERIRPNQWRPTRHRMFVLEK